MAAGFDKADLERRRDHVRDELRTRGSGFDAPGCA
jgi:hypothetical protein